MANLKIAVDVMGGDSAPAEIVKGALEAAHQFNQEIILVGDEAIIRQEMAGCPDKLVSVVHASEVISMSESPSVAVRRKKGSSIVRAVHLLKEGTTAALVSAGNTGAVMAAGVLFLGLIVGIDRPALATTLPSKGGWTLLLDVGANVDCKTYHLLQFAIMGYLYAQEILGIHNPRVGLLSIGEEETKGNELTLAAYPLLANAGINFIGNVEGRDIYQDTVNVVVCDGFVGNIVLKSVEGMSAAFMQMMKEETTKKWFARAGFAMTMFALRDFRRRLDYAEYGGAPLLGVNGVIIVCHGSSTSRAIKNAIHLAGESVQKDLVSAIKNSIQKIQGKGRTT
jgi:glycerol-3-phosphate acyltransferase PlsX